VLLGATAIADWHDTYTSVTSQPNSPVINHPTAWTSLAAHMANQNVAAGPFRLALTGYQRATDNPVHTTVWPDARIYSYASFDHARAYGLEAKAEVPALARYGVTGYLNYALGRVYFYNPVAGGFITEAEHVTETGRFLAPMDQTHTLTAGATYRLDPDLINSVILAESGFNSRAVSPKGAQGLMQLMPATAGTLGVTNPLDPQANVDGGTRYLRQLLERYNFDLIKALAAYNAGPLRVQQYRGVPPYRETQAYVAKIVHDYNRKKIAQEKAAAAAKKNHPRKVAAANPAGAKAQLNSGNQQHD